jgi:hypothetical protein
MGMGAAMGVMMPIMVHGLGAAALVWFVLAHLAVIGGVALAGIWALRRFGHLPAWLSGHRPSGRHVAQMLAGAALGFAVLHVSAHGFGAA